MLDSPNSEPRVQPAAVLLPPARGDGVDAHEDVRLAQLDGLPPVDERVRGGVLGEVHRDRVDLGFGGIVPRRDGADWNARFIGQRPGGGQRTWRLILTDGEQERAPRERRCGRVEDGVEDRDEGLAWHGGVSTVLGCTRETHIEVGVESNTKEEARKHQHTAPGQRNQARIHLKQLVDILGGDEPMHEDLRGAVLLDQRRAHPEVRRGPCTYIKSAPPQKARKHPPSPGMKYVSFATP